MTAPSADTIFARASGAGKAGVAVWRVSGPEAFAVAARLVGSPLPDARRASLRALRSEDGEMLDRGLALLFPAPGSFTGEDVAEFHTHGGRALETALFEAFAHAGARPARAGEFTRRALVNGRLDLAEAEALADLLDAETDLQRRQALAQFDGRLSARAEAWRRRLVAALAPLEAAIDFPDEEDVPAAIAERAGPQIDALLAELKGERREAFRARSVRDGVRIAIVGAPNVGKSTLLNRLAGSDLAIVSETPGTTRDVIEVRLDLGGLPAFLADTAGLRSAGDAIEAEGIRRTRERAESADLRLLVADVASRAEGVPRETQALLRPGDLLLWNKSDLSDTEPDTAGRSAVTAPGTDMGDELWISAKTGAGIEQLTAALTARVVERFAPLHEGGLTRARHVDAVDRAIAALQRSGGRLDSPEIAAEDVRLAIRALDEIAGKVDVEEVLDAIFASFCIGK